MMKAFYKIDLFGKAVLFNYRGHSKSKSKVGAIFTILLILFIIWLVIDFSQDLIHKTDPKATTSESINDNPSPMPLNKNTFAFAIAISDPYSFANKMNESIFTINAYASKTTRVPQPNGTVNIIYENLPLDLEPCTADHFGELANKFSFVALDQMYCIKEQQQYINTTYPILEGNFESPVFQNIVMEFKVCDNDTSTVACGTQDEINDLLEGGFVSLSFANIALDLTDNKEPSKPYRDSFYTTIGTSFNKGLTLYLQQIEIKTDSGWFTTDYKTENYIKYDHINEMFTPAVHDYFLYFNIRLGNVKMQHTRSYTKVQDVIAKVNGLIAVAFTVLYLLLSPYVRIKFYEALINEIFDIKLSKGKLIEKKSRGKAKLKKMNQNSTEHKNTANTLAKEQICFSQEDLESQRSPLKPPTDVILNNVPPERKRNETNKKKNQILKEPYSAQFNLNDPIQSPLKTHDNEPLVSLETEAYRLKRKSRDSELRFQSEVQLTSRFSQSETKPGINIEVPSELYSPIDLKRELSSSRRPAFMKFPMKVLDYEDNGQDFVEDLLKNIQEHPTKYNNAPPMVENATAMIKTEEKDNEDLNTKTMKEGMYYTTEVWPPETKRSNNEEKEHKDEEINDDNERHKNSNPQQILSKTSKKSETINLSLWEYIRSKFSRSELIKEKMDIIDEGIKRINERLDIFNLFKKLREFDKLKVLLLENEQFVLFDSLPRPELALKNNNPSLARTSSYLSQSKIKDAQFIQDKIKNDLILLSYEHLKRKENPTMIDRKLFEIYQDLLSVHS